MCLSIQISMELPIFKNISVSIEFEDYYNARDDFIR